MHARTHTHTLPRYEKNFNYNESMPFDIYIKYKDPLSAKSSAIKYQPSNSTCEWTIDQHLDTQLLL
jgi:hypothetical protein